MSTRNPSISSLLSGLIESRLLADSDPSQAHDDALTAKAAHLKVTIGAIQFYQILGSYDYRSLALVIRDQHALPQRADRHARDYLEIVRREYERRITSDIIQSDIPSESSQYRLMNVRGNHLLLVLDEIDHEALKPYTINALAGYPSFTGGVIHRYVAERAFGDNTGYTIDHINNIPFDARRSNLRRCTQGQNAFNRRMPVTNSTGYKGICLRKDANRYDVQICVDGKRATIGRFDDKRDAAIAYDIYARKYHGEFAKLNVPDVSMDDLDRVTRLMVSNKVNQVSSSRYYGVSKRRGYSRWRACFTYRKKKHHVGDYSTEEEAARAVDAKLIEMGHLSRLNFNRPVDDMISVSPPWPKRQRAKTISQS